MAVSPFNTKNKNDYLLYIVYIVVYIIYIIAQLYKKIKDYVKDGCTN